jgi:hypothetical protein
MLAGFLILPIAGYVSHGTTLSGRATVLQEVTGASDTRIANAEVQSTLPSADKSKTQALVPQQTVTADNASLTAGAGSATASTKARTTSASTYIRSLNLVVGPQLMITSGQIQTQTTAACSSAAKVSASGNSTFNDLSINGGPGQQQRDLSSEHRHRHAGYAGR